MKIVEGNVMRDMTPEEEAEVLAVRAASEAEAPQRISNQRLGRYKAESDPLYAEWVYETERAVKTAEELALMKQAWLDKVAEIKAALPFPTE